MARASSIEDWEISLIKGMINSEFANDWIAYKFSREDRIVNQGRISDIKKGKIGSNLTAASQKEVNLYLKNKEITIDKIEEIIKSRLIIDSDGLLQTTQEENEVFEFKEDFEKIEKYTSSIAGFSNNQGGYLIFGINKNGIVVGIGNKFEKLDTADITNKLQTLLSPRINFSKQVFLLDNNKKIGILKIEKAFLKPIITKKNNDYQNQSTIYFRYVGKSEAIKHDDLFNLLKERDEENIKNQLENINRISKGEIALLDTKTGLVQGKSGSFIIDETLLTKIKFIKEGNFSQVDGSPTLKLIGNLEKTSIFTKNEKVEVVRDTVTPEALVRNFLENKTVENPKAYLNFLLQAPRKWMPIWHYIKMIDEPLITLIEEIKITQTTHNERKSNLLNRLQGKTSAYAENGLRFKVIRSDLINCSKNNTVNCQEFCKAIIGLKEIKDDIEIDYLKTKFLEYFNTIMNEINRNDNHLSLLYKSICNLDEMLNKYEVS